MPPPMTGVEVTLRVGAAGRIAAASRKTAWPPIRRNKHPGIAELLAEVPACSIRAKMFLAHPLLDAAGGRSHVSACHAAAGVHALVTTPARASR